MARASTLDLLAWALSKKLGRNITVTAVRGMAFKGHNSRGNPTFKEGSLRYSILVPGCSPELFQGMTVNECKARLAMLSDMLSSDVIRPGKPHDAPIAAPDHRSSEY